jgi:putative oxidoreductase
MEYDLSDILYLAGRIMLGGLFVFAGIRHFTVLEPGTAAVASRGVPYPRAVFMGGSVFEAICGLLLMFGFWPVETSLALFVFTLAASIMLLDFWNRNGLERVVLFNNFTSNIGVLGGLLISAATAT